jgi:hypothetical protein
MRASIFLWGALAIGVGVSLFLVKYKVQALENELIARQEQVIRDRAAVRVLQAEWTHLNNPERLRRMSAEHLGFVPPTAKNVADIAALPLRSASPEAQAPAQAIAPAPTPATSQNHTALRTPAPKVAAAAPKRPNVGQELFARLQRMLFPSAVGATTSAGRTP